MKLGIRTKLIACFLTVGIVPMAAASWLSNESARTGFDENYQLSAEALETTVESKLEGTTALRRDALASYLDRAFEQLLLFADDPAMLTGLASSIEGFGLLEYDRVESGTSEEAMRASVRSYFESQFGGNFRETAGVEPPSAASFVAQLDLSTVAAQYDYISNNPHPLGSKHDLYRADTGTVYDLSHAELHPTAKAYLDLGGYYDIFLVDGESGKVVYSVFKEVEYGTSLFEGPFASEGIGRAFRSALELGEGEIAVADFENYTPSYMAAAAFISTPMFVDGDKRGVAIFQLPLDQITAVVSDRTGLGQTGESFVVGPDRLMRSDSFLDPENFSVAASFANPEAGRVATDSVTRALNGESGVARVTSYHGGEVISAFAPVKFGDTTWAVQTEQSVDEALAAKGELAALAASANARTKSRALTVAGVSALGILVVGFLFAARITAPIRRTGEVLGHLAEGDFTHSVDVSSNDEIGAIGHALNQAMERLSSTIARVGENGELIDRGTDVINDSSQELSSNASESAASLEEISASLEQLTSMVAQTANNTREANRLSNDATGAADRGVEEMQAMVMAMGSITQSSSEIADIINVIEEIAFQTNLLALNAAVEAARAGEAGAGFAVVAEEVRSLAMRSAEAAQDTNTKIKAASQNAKNGTEIATRMGNALSDIVSSTRNVNAILQEIGSATEEQNQGLKQVNESVGALDGATQRNAGNAEELAATAEESSARAAELRALIAGFRVRGGVSGATVQPTNRSTPRMPQFAAAAPAAAVAPAAPATPVAPAMTAAPAETAAPAAPPAASVPAPLPSSTASSEGMLDMSVEPDSPAASDDGAHIPMMGDEDDILFSDAPGASLLASDDELEAF